MKQPIAPSERPPKEFEGRWAVVQAARRLRGEDMPYISSQLVVSLGWKLIVDLFDGTFAREMEARDAGKDVPKDS